MRLRHPVAKPFFPPTLSGSTGTTSRPLSFIASNSSLIASRLTSLSKFLFAATNGFLAFLRISGLSLSTEVQGLWFARIQPKQTGFPN